MITLNDRTSGGPLRSRDRRSSDAEHAIIGQKNARTEQRLKVKNAGSAIENLLEL